jgi:hypothetical protein
VEKAWQYSAVTPKFVSLAFMLLWTSLAAGSTFWSWRWWRRSRQQRTVRMWIGECDEADFPRLFTILSVSQLVGVAISSFLVLVGSYVLFSVAATS